MKHDENFGGKVLEGGRFGANGENFGGKIGGTKSDRKEGNMFLWLLELIITFSHFWMSETRVPKNFWRRKPKKKRPKDVGRMAGINKKIVEERKGEPS